MLSSNDLAHLRDRLNSLESNLRKYPKNSYLKKTGLVIIALESKQNSFEVLSTPPPPQKKKKQKKQKKKKTKKKTRNQNERAEVI